VKPSASPRLYWLSALTAAALFMGGLREPASAAWFMVALWGAVILADGGVDLRRAGPWTALAAWSLLSALMNPAAGPEGLASSARYWAAAAFFVCAASTPGFDRFLRGLLLAAGSAGAAVLFYERLAGLAPSGILPPNPNYTAALAGAAAVLLFSGALSSSGRRRLLLAAWGLALAASLAALNSRGALLAAWVSSVWLLFSGGRRRAGAALLAAPFLAAFLLPQNWLDGLLKLSDPHAYRRLDIWRSALSAFADRPVSGWGPGAFRHAFELFKFPAFNGISFFGHSTVHAHSEPLQLLAETGLPGAAAYLWGFWYFFGRSVRPALAAAALFLFVQSAVDGIFMAWALQLLMLASLAAAGETPAGEARNSSLFFAEFSAERLARVLPAMAAAALAAGSWQWQARHAAGTACAYSGGAPRVRAECASSALRFSPYREGLHLARAEALAAWSGSAAAGAAAAEAGLESLPGSVFLHYRAAGFYISGGAAGRAEELLKKALYLEPNFVRARLSLAELYESSGRKGAASAERELAGKAAALAGSAVSPYDRELTSRGPLWKRTGATTASTRE